MSIYKLPPNKPLFTDQKEKEVFMSLFNDFDDVNHKRVAKLLFCDGLTIKETAENANYSERQTDRLKTQLLKVALKRAIGKLITTGVIPNDR